VQIVNKINSSHRSFDGQKRRGQYFDALDQQPQLQQGAQQVSHGRVILENLRAPVAIPEQMVVAAGVTLEASAQAGGVINRK